MNNFLCDIWMTRKRERERFFSTIYSFLGMSPIKPFMVVVAQQLGIPVSIAGTLVAVPLLMVVLTKPLLAGIADTFPSYRRSIFLINLIVMVVSFSSLNFVTPMQGLPRVQGQLGVVQGIAEPPPTTPVTVVVEGQESDSGDGTTLMLAATNEGECALSKTLAFCLFLQFLKFCFFSSFNNHFFTFFKNSE